MRLRSELLSLLDAGSLDYRHYAGLSRQYERLGGLEDCLRDAVRRSSVCLYNGGLYYFGGRLYEPMSFDEWKTVLTDLLFDDIRIPRTDYGLSYHIIGRLTSLARSKPMRLNRSLMVFGNGVLNTETLEFHARFGSEFVQLWGVDYDYDAGAKTFMWHQFLHQVLPDAEMRRCLQMFLGATFVDRRKVRIEHLVVLLGKGANGKGVVNQTIHGVLGDNMSSESIGNLCARGLEGMSSLARINGKRLNFGTEMSSQDFRRRDARLKSIVSGEPTTARFLYGQPFEACDIPLLMSSANMIPYFDSGDDAMLRRIYPIPFDIVIPPERRNPALCDDLRDEYPGIFNWIMEGRKEFVRNGCRLPESNKLTELLRRGRAEYDTSLAFMEKKGYRPKFEGVDVAPRNFVKIKNLYEEYVRWCNSNGIYCQSKSSFISSLERYGFVRSRRAEGHVFYVFGQITLNSFAKDADALRKKNVEEKAPSSSMLFFNGESWVTSLRALSAYSGVGEKTLSRLVSEGAFGEYMKHWKEKPVYHIEGCCNVLRERCLMATDKEKDIRQRIQKELKYMRAVFNSRMEYHQLPYRKYAHEDQIDDSVRVVPDEMTDDEVFDMAREELGFSGEVRASAGAFGRDGKGYFESLDCIPTDEEREILKQSKKPKNKKKK